MITMNKPMKNTALKTTKIAKSTVNDTGFAYSRPFFEDLVESCCAMRREGVTVIVAGLTLTFERQPFGEMRRLLDFSDEIVPKKAVCAVCNSWNATLTHRKTSEKSVVVVGGANLYIPVCQMCFENVYTQ